MRAESNEIGWHTGALLLAVLCLAGCGEAPAPSVEKENAMPPGRTATSGPLAFTAWGQEDGEQSLASLEIEYVGDSAEPVMLRRVSLTLFRPDAKNEEIEKTYLEVERDHPVCVMIPSEPKLSKLVVRAEDAAGTKVGPLTYDFALAPDAPAEATEFDVEETQVHETQPGFLSTPLGYLYKVGRLTVEPLGKTGQEPKHFVVLSFRGKELLRFTREAYRIRDVATNEPYLWSSWIYVGETVSLPGSATTGFGPHFNPERGPLLLRDCRRFDVLYEVPEHVHRVRIDFDGR